MTKEATETQPQIFFSLVFAFRALDNFSIFSFMILCGIIVICFAPQRRQCSVDFFISGEYYYKVDKSATMTLDSQIMDKLKYADIDKKRRILQMIDLL